jgi:membrane-associated phospholipid phosphatase
MALVSALVAFYPDQIWIALVGYPLVTAVAIGMVEGDAHWFSDIVAGALIGHAIGWAVGRGFRNAYDQQLRDESSTASSDPDPLLRQLSVSPPATLAVTFQF